VVTCVIFITIKMNIANPFQYIFTIQIRNGQKSKGGMVFFKKPDENSRKSLIRSELGEVVMKVWDKLMNCRLAPVVSDAMM
jgi:hypothetical protein